MRHVNIPIFIPHLGCPNQCVFCNQRAISGHGDFDISSVRDEIETALATISPDCETEIAFFGGSFTGIEQGLMRSLLELADEYVLARKVSAIRLSTRPDYIDENILDILKEHHVTDIELGLQSMQEHVLIAAKRGHSADSARKACKLIRERGFTLIGQMMIGLPCSTHADELATAREIVKLCDGARIYPTVVFRNTELASMLQKGEYAPLTIDEAVERTASVLEVFAQANKPVLRIGLCASDNLADPTEAIAGATHPALGELVLSELMWRKIEQSLPSDAKQITIEVNPRELSQALGQKRKNLEKLKQKGIQAKFKPSADISPHCIKIKQKQ